MSAHSHDSTPRIGPDPTTPSIIIRPFNSKEHRVFGVANKANTTGKKTAEGKKTEDGILTTTPNSRSSAEQDVKNHNSFWLALEQRHRSGTPASNNVNSNSTSTIVVTPDKERASNQAKKNHHHQQQQPQQWNDSRRLIGDELYDRLWSERMALPSTAAVPFPLQNYEFSDLTSLSDSGSTTLHTSEDGDVDNVDGDPTVKEKEEKEKKGEVVRQRPPSVTQPELNVNVTQTELNVSQRQYQPHQLNRPPLFRRSVFHSADKEQAEQQHPMLFTPLSSRHHQERPQRQQSRRLQPQYQPQPHRSPSRQLFSLWGTHQVMGL